MSEKTIVSEPFDIRLNEQLSLHGNVKAVQDGSPKPVVVAVHGFRGSRDWGFWPEVTDSLAANGFYAVSFSFSRVTAKDNGLSEQVIAEASTIAQELIDLEVILRQIKQRLLPLRDEADERRVAVIGHSRAGSSSIIAAAEQPEDIQAVIVWNGGAAPQAGAKHSNDVSLVQQVIADDVKASGDRYHILSQFKTLKQPSLIVQGSKDNERLIAANARLREEVPDQTYVTIDGADHTFGAEHPYRGATLHLKEALEASLAFLKKVY